MSTDWYNRITAGDTRNRVATKAGIIPSTLNRQLDSGAISAETVVSIARAYGANVLDALIEQGLLAEEDVLAHPVQAALSEATDRELVAEILRRLKSGTAHPVLDEPIDLADYQKPQTITADNGTVDTNPESGN